MLKSQFILNEDEDGDSIDPNRLVVFGVVCGFFVRVLFLLFRCVCASHFVQKKTGGVHEYPVMSSKARRCDNICVTSPNHTQSRVVSCLTERTPWIPFASRASSIALVIRYAIIGSVVLWFRRRIGERVRLLLLLVLFIFSLMVFCVYMCYFIYLTFSIMTKTKNSSKKGVSGQNQKVHLPSSKK